MHAPEIVDELARRARARHGDDARVLREWAIGAASCRVDLAVVNGRIDCFEVKSAHDRVARLPRQAEAYSGVADRAVLVVEQTSWTDRAVALVPPWWGVWCVRRDGAVLRVRPLRSQRPNPTPDPFAISQLLWREEAMALLVHRDRARGLSRATRWRLWAEVAANVPLAELRPLVRAAIRARPALRSDG